jgi:hypothetical protein
MTTFAPSGKSIVLAYADDSTDTSTIEGGAIKFLIVNTDAANVVAVNFGFTDNDVDAIIPTSGDNGRGTIVGPASQLIVDIPQCAYATQVFVSVAGVSPTGNVYLTPGA